MLLHRILPISLGLALSLVLAGAPARAASIDTVVSPFTGDPGSVHITLDDAGAGAGEILVTVEVMSPLGDLRGLFLDISDDSLLPGLSAGPSPPITASDFSGNVGSAGNSSNNVKGGGSPCPCDFGVEIGTPGMGRDDFQIASFVLRHSSVALDVSLFFDQLVAVRVTSVGEEGNRTGSSKFAGRLPVPEPGSAALLTLGLAGLLLGSPRRPAH